MRKTVVFLLFSFVLLTACGNRGTAPLKIDTQEALSLVFAAPSAPENSKKNLAVGEIPDIENVYDGDTIKDVRFLVCEPCDLKNPLLPLLQEGEKVYFLTDIRIRDIDTPELRPRKAGRTEASLQHEKAFAVKARDYLRYLLTEADHIYIEHQQEEKYYGRIVADVLIEKDGIVINAGQTMIKCGYAVHYDGSTKTIDWGTKDMTRTCEIPD